MYNGQKILAGSSLFLIMILLLLAVPEYALAQGSGQIQGQVTDAETGEPLPGVNVTIPEIQRGAATDEDGEYVIIGVPAGTYDVVASFVGYSTVRQTDVLIEIDRTTTLDFSLEPAVVEQEEVVVQAEREILHKEVSSSQQIVTPEALDKAPGTRSLEDFLQKQAAFTGEMEIRGGSADQIGAVVDGISLSSERFDEPQMSIPLSAIRQVSVMSGGYNAEYGDFRSGIVNITTKNGSPDEYEGRIDISASAPRMKHFGSSIYSPQNYFLRPHLDPSVAFVGTEEAWADDPQLRQQYSRFAGWENMVDDYNAGKSPEQQATALDLYLWNAWMHMIELPVKELEAAGYEVDPELAEKFANHAREREGTNSDWNIDAGLGGPIPFLSRSLGNATFYVSHTSQKNFYSIPVKRRAHRVHSTLLTLQSIPTPNLRLNLKGYYSKNLGTLEATTAYSSPELGFQPVDNLYNVRDVNSGVSWYPDFYSPGSRTTAMIGLNVEHSITSRTQWSAQLSMTRNYDQAGAPYTPRDSTIIRFGPIEVLEEMPYGWSPGNTSVGGTRYGEYETPYGISNYYANLGHAWFDSTITNQYNLNLDFSSQIGDHNLVKTGIDLGYDHFDNNLWTFRFGHPENNNNYYWDRSVLKAGFFAQDQITYEGIVANLGVRLDYYSPQGTWPTGARYNFNVYGGATQDIWERWQELDEQSDSDILKPIESQLVASPRLGLSFPVTENSKFFFNYGHFRSMTPSRNMWMVAVDEQGGLQEIGSPNMAPPRTIAYETGVEYNLLNSYLFRISGYYKDVTGQHGEITYISQDGRLSYDSYNNNEYRDIQGVEFSVSKRAGQWLTGWINYNYMLEKTGYTGLEVYYEDPSQRAEFGFFEGEQSRPVPRPRFNANVTLSTPSDWGEELIGANVLGNWQFSVQPTWIAGPWFTWNPLGKLHLQDNLQWPNYHVWDIKLSKPLNIAGSTVEAYLEVDNVFNQKTSNMASGIPFSSGADERNYLASLHLPMYDSKEFETLRERNPGKYIAGDDEPGMLRSEERPYINDPNITMLLYSQPRSLWFGLDVRF